VAIKKNMTVDINDIRIKVFARQQMGIAEDKEFINWAVQELLHGNETNSIKILAGLENPINPFQIKEYINKSKKELKIEFDENNIIDQYAMILAKQKLNNEISSRDIATEMYEILKYTDFNNKYFAWDNIDEYFDDFHVYIDTNLEEEIIKECNKIINK
jgi:hypothetical protein